MESGVTNLGTSWNKSVNFEGRSRKSIQRMSFTTTVVGVENPRRVRNQESTKGKKLGRALLQIYRIKDFVKLERGLEKSH